MRLIFRIRPLNYFFNKNWYGKRSGAIWGDANMLDLGAITLGWAKK